MNKTKMLWMLIFSQLFSVVGTVVLQFTLSLYVLDLTGSALTFSVITSLAVIGRLIMLPFCGILADRLNKKIVMITMDGSYFAVAILLLLALQTEHPVLLIGILTCLLGMISAFETPVVQSAIPLMCDEENIPKANSAVSSIGILGNMLGPVLAGMIYRQNTISLIFIGCLFLFGAAIAIESRMSFQNLAVTNKFVSLFQVVKEDLTDVVHYLKEKTIILKICILAFILNFLLNSFVQVVVPYIARIWLQVSNQQFGIMNFLFATGGLVGSILYGLLSKKVKLTSVPLQLVMTGIIFSTLMLALGNSAGVAFWGMTAIVALIMALFTMISVQLMVFIQTQAAQNLLGRLMSFVMIVSTLATPLGQLLFGWLSEIMTINQMQYLIGVISLLTVLIALFSKKIFSSIGEHSHGQTAINLDKSPSDG
ncbi:MFS transporter [Enterococcus sp. HY326]|uniref:MFS transporter n=1 Tax=Enterococcus sp. HY326 TaxID=2971265 RepID=UPI00223F8600|nr:MFS transporter [Enterococcus sp. HY326]